MARKRSITIGSPPSFVVDNFVLGYTEVTPTNVGVTSVWKDKLVQHVGDFTLSYNGQLVEGLDITGRVIFGDYTGTVRNCVVRVGAATTYGQQRTAINCFGEPGAGFNRLIQFCEVRPSAPSVDIYGIAGWGYRLERSLIVDCVDTVNVQRSPSYTSHSAKIISNYLATLFYEVDPRQTDGSHNDGGQIFFGSANEVTGNTIVNPDRRGQCVIFNTNASASGDSQLKNAIVRRNRLVGGYTQISVWDQAATMPGLVCEDNVHVGSRGSSGTHQWDLLITSANNTAAASISGNKTDTGAASHVNVNG